MAEHTDLKFLLTCARGAEPYLASELESLGATDINHVPGGVTCSGDYAFGMKACLHVRVGNKVLLQLTETRVRNEKQVYDAVRAIDLNPWFDTESTLAVWTHLNDRRFNNSHFLSLKIKDAIVDDVRDRLGSRPNVDTNDPVVGVHAYVLDGTFRLYLGMHGDALFQRGYRSKTGDAPLKETLAATVLAFADWTGDTPLVDPMCGSGTIVIEAAMIAARQAPGLSRSFGFERWPGFAPHRERWESIVDEALQQRREVSLTIAGFDNNPSVLAAARQNAVGADVTDIVSFGQRDVGELEGLEPPGLVVVNPPYGERIGGESERVDELHHRLSERARQLDGHRLCLISLAPILKRTMRMRPAKTAEIYNGRLRCQMACYPLGRPPKETPPHEQRES